MDGNDDDPSLDQTGAEPARPHALDYFSAQSERAPGGRAATVLSLLLVASWLPYVCGVLNASTLPILYTPSIISAHLNGAILFMGLGMGVSAIALVGFLRLKHPAGAWGSAIVLMVQITMAVCAGMAL